MDKQGSAVSPVVGVMLMLAVTIMIAAIVSATAGNFTNTEKKAPSAILDVSIYAAKDYGGYYVPTMTIKHVSGNPLQTKDLQVITYYTDPDSRNISRGALAGEKSVSIKSIQEGVLYLTRDNESVSQSTWFGNASATLMPGDMLVTPAMYCGSSGDGSTTDSPDTNPSITDYLFPNVTLHSGNEATIKIVHIPSGQILFDKDVVIS